MPGSALRIRIFWDFVGFPLAISEINNVAEESTTPSGHLSAVRAPLKFARRSVSSQQVFRCSRRDWITAVAGYKDLIHGTPVYG
jgi:hypothetical protein